MVAATPGHPAIFDVLVGLHVACALVGFGFVAISGVYGSTARHCDREDAAEETARYFGSRNCPELLLLAVPFLGAAALAVRPGGAGFGDVWVIGASIVWLAAAVLLTRVVRPAERRIRESRGSPSDVRSAGTALMWASGACDVLFVVALALMVAQPA